MYRKKYPAGPIITEVIDDYGEKKQIICLHENEVNILYSLFDFIERITGVTTIFVSVVLGS